MAKDIKVSSLVVLNNMSSIKLANVTFLGLSSKRLGDGDAKALAEMGGRQVDVNDIVITLQGAVWAPDPEQTMEVFRLQCHLSDI